MTKSSMKCLKTTKALTERINHSPTYSIEQAIDELRDVYQFSFDRLTEQELRRIVGRCARQVLGENGTRSAYLLPKRGIIVNLNTCNDEELIGEVREIMRQQLQGYRNSYRKVLKRYEAITGQITIDDLFAEPKDLQKNG